MSDHWEKLDETTLNEPNLNVYIELIQEMAAAIKLNLEKYQAITPKPKGGSPSLILYARIQRLEHFMKILWDWWSEKNKILQKDHRDDRVVFEICRNTRSTITKCYEECRRIINDVETELKGTEVPQLLRPAPPEFLELLVEEQRDVSGEHPSVPTLVPTREGRGGGGGGGGGGGVEELLKRRKFEKIERFEDDNEAIHRFVQWIDERKKEYNGVCVYYYPRACHSGQRGEQRMSGTGDCEYTLFNQQKVKIDAITQLEERLDKWLWGNLKAGIKGYLSRETPPESLKRRGVEFQITAERKERPIYGCSIWKWDQDCFSFAEWLTLNNGVYPRDYKRNANIFPYEKYAYDYIADLKAKVNTAAFKKNSHKVEMVSKLLNIPPDTRVQLLHDVSMEKSFPASSLYSIKSKWAWIMECRGFIQYLRNNPFPSEADVHGDDTGNFWRDWLRKATNTDTFNPTNINERTTTFKVLKGLDTRRDGPTDYDFTREDASMSMERNYKLLLL